MMLSLNRQRVTLFAELSAFGNTIYFAFNV